MEQYPRSKTALDALFLPITDALVTPVRGPELLFLGARWHRQLECITGGAPVLIQSWKSHSEELERHGFSVEDGPIHGSFQQVLVMASRQRDETRARFARALRHASEGATVLAAQRNDQGAKSAQADFSRLFGQAHSLSRHKCRVFWATVDPARIDGELQEEWLALDRVRANESGYLSRPGLFAWRKVDPASAMLARHVPGNLRGAVADLGAGYGYLACELVRRCSGVTSLDLFEVDARALDPARRNVEYAAAEAGREIPISTHWHDVSTGLPGRYDHVVANPPFHQDRADSPELGRSFLAAGAKALKPRGSMWLVANRHLPYESVMGELFARVETLEESGGFKVLRAEV